MPKRVAILQSNYIPWKGYFDIIHDVDEFIFHDDLQYTKQDWRNRNRIKTPLGPEWLTIPVGSSERRLICEVDLPTTSWARFHWRRLQETYGRARHFERYRPLFEDIYLGKKWLLLSDLNQHIIRAIARELGIPTGFRDSRELNLNERKQERVLQILEKVDATAYISGPTASGYLEKERFDACGIELMWKDYQGYPEYPQFHPPFLHEVTILDLLFHVGPEGPEYIWGWRTKPR
jgi:hypothetical protein